MHCVGFFQKTSQVPTVPYTVYQQAFEKTAVTKTEPSAPVTATPQVSIAPPATIPTTQGNSDKKHNWEKVHFPVPTTCAACFK